jgi:hypothetical protein
MTIIEEATMKSIQGIYKKLPDFNGVTLRDLFALTYINGLFNNRWFELMTKDENIEKLAKASYEFADVMIKTRSQK